MSDRAIAWFVTGPLGRFAAFWLALGGAFGRTLLNKVSRNED